MAGSVTITEEELRIVDAILTEHVPDAAVWAFGSRVTGRARPYSDLDLVIETDATASGRHRRPGGGVHGVRAAVEGRSPGLVDDQRRSAGGVRSQRVLLPTPAPAV